MAKAKDDDFVFDKLKNLNLDIPANLDVEDVKREKVPDEKPVKEEDRVGGPKLHKQEKVEAPTIKTSFKIERDLHLALKHYSLIQGEEMATVVFEQVMKPFLEKKGYYPPRK